MDSPSPARRGILLGLSVVCLIGSVALGYRLFQPKPAQARSADAAEAAKRAVARGLQALDANDGPTALAAFTEAETALKEIKSVGRVEQLGELYWLRFQTARDLPYAKALVDGRPLATADDSSTGEQYRPVRLTDPKAFNQAVADLLQAVERTDDAETHKTALRFLLTLPTVPWNAVETVAKATLKSNPSDGRANYLMARIQFEQPQTGSNLPMPAEKRHSDRMLKAGDYLAKAQSARVVPLWRTVALEARISDWMLRFGHLRRNDRKSLTAERKKLDALLFAPGSGAVARAAAGEGFTGMSKFDVDGLFGVLTLALQWRAEDLRAGQTPPDTLTTIAGTTAAVVGKIAAGPSAGLMKDALGQVVTALQTAEAAFGAKPPPGWSETVAPIRTAAQ